jgi:phage protein D
MSMSDIIKTINGQLVSQGEIKKAGNYLTYSFLEFQHKSGQVELIENISINPKMASELTSGVSFQFADGKKLNSVYKQYFLVGMQQKNGNVVVDDRVMRYTTKTRFFLARLSSWVPYLGKHVLDQAEKLREAQDQVGAFEPLEKNFITQTKKKKV